MADNNQKNRPVVPEARRVLDELKVEVAQEIGWNPASLQDLGQKIDRSKYEVAREINVPLKPGDNGELTSRQAGAVGGRLGGHLGGQMTKRLIQAAEQMLSRKNPT